MSATKAARTCAICLTVSVVVLIHIYFIWHWIAGYFMWFSSSGTLGDDPAAAAPGGAKV